MSNTIRDNQTNSSKIRAFIRYFNEMKPYHTKILEVLEQFNIFDELNIEMEEEQFYEFSLINRALCDLPEDSPFDCQIPTISYGGYGEIWDDNDLLVEEPIVTTISSSNEIVVDGNASFDKRFQILSIPNSSTAVIAGNQISNLENHKLFRLIPRRALPILSCQGQTYAVQGNYVSDFLRKKEFSVVGSGINDGRYSVLSASYDQNSDQTTVLISNTQTIDSTFCGGLIEIPVEVRNQGFYAIDSLTFNGVNTIISLDNQALFDFTDNTEGNNHGSVVIRTALSARRRITVSGNVTENDKEYYIQFTNYDNASDQTTICVLGSIPITGVSGGNVELRGYSGGVGFDDDGEYNNPMAPHLFTRFSEVVVIESTPSNITPTPTPTPTVTPSAAPAAYYSGGGSTRIDSFPFSSPFTTTTNVGNLSQLRYGAVGTSGPDDAFVSGGFYTDIDSFPFSNPFTTSTQIGTLINDGKYNASGQWDLVNSFISGGGYYNSEIDTFPFSNPFSTSTIAGNLNATIDNQFGQSSSEDGYSTGGNSGGGVSNVVTDIDSFPFSNPFTTATDVGDLTVGRMFGSSQFNDTDAYSSGGRTSPGGYYSTIETFPFSNPFAFASTSGDLVSGKYRVSGVSSSDSGYSGGVFINNEIENFPFANPFTTATIIGQFAVGGYYTKSTNMG